MFKNLASILSIGVWSNPSLFRIEPFYLLAGLAAAKAVKGVRVGVNFQAGGFVIVGRAFEHVVFVGFQVIAVQHCEYA